MAKKRTDREDLNAFLAFYKESTAALLAASKAYNRRLRKDPNPIIRGFKEDLADLNTGGKMLRGTLIRLGCALSGAENLGISNDLAIAFEMFQTGILIHDDIIDNAETRRGKFTIQHRYEKRLKVRNTRMLAEVDGPRDVARSAALCTGDLGIYSANCHLAKSYGDHPAFSKLITYFDETVIDTIRGEILDVVLPYELQDESYDEETRKKLLEKSVRDIYHLKTSRYSVIGPLHLGMLLGGMAEEHMRAADRFADEIGIAYQIMDDILGIYADAGYLGKDVGSDISEFKQTILWMYVHNEKPEAAEELLQYYGKKKIREKDLESVRRIFRESGALDYAKSVMEACFDRAGRKLSRMRFLTEEQKAILRGFIVWCSLRSR